MLNTNLTRGNDFVDVIAEIKNDNILCIIAVLRGQSVSIESLVKPPYKFLGTSTNRAGYTIQYIQFPKDGGSAIYPLLVMAEMQGLAMSEAANAGASNACFYHNNDVEEWDRESAEIFVYYDLTRDETDAIVEEPKLQIHSDRTKQMPFPELPPIKFAIK